MYGSRRRNEHGLLSVLFGCVTSRTYRAPHNESNSSCCIAVYEGAWISAPRLKGAQVSSRRNRLIAVWRR
jgi:hypothetical protein